ncbi:gallate 1-beta-glucosyltransferase 84A24 [Ricinus communis]|uniref:Glycosyltransferase n=1 Tax=Ricinus communis TaxID=3988 RepID=B9RY86_RICCO|nr:gallate 1-beta-glucosyltransferase 84A24 [Ricinus communis]EEF43595.1 UDP-glucosyltransferase, putative [Ricinus communis]|eukprot:XP_002518670.1 gallate 1-beta-glucosyltransferase [Ricinus communis]
MVASGSPVHVLLVSFPAQGHVNPLLRLGKRLASKGLLVTFAAPEIVGKQMRNANNITDHESIPVGDGFIRFEFFEEGLEEDDPRRKDLDQYIAQLELVGKQVIPEMIRRNSEEGRPVSCLINNPFIPWVSDVAEDLGLPSAMLWVQSCGCFSAYYHYYHDLAPFPSEENPETDVELPFMPVLKYDEVPSFLHPSTPFPFLRRAILGQFKNLEKPFCILMETFQELEHDLIEYMSKFCPIKPVGPLYKDPKALNSDVKGDFLKADDCIEWLDTKPPSSVVYVSFGSVVYFNQEQWIEIAYGLLNSDVSFLWVMKPPAKESVFEPVVLPDEFLEKVADKGKVVQWSPQEKVLAHQSIACFVTHCGWNSTMEALSSGVPVVCYPQWGDQVTDAKYLVDVFKVGVRMCRGMAENKLITRDEMKKCLLEATVGPKAAEIRQNALKWKEAAEAAVAEGGSSDMNMQGFVDKIKRMRNV